ncbi:MAG TPA: sulfotransferase [Acidimicrobiales bacterium]|nr:sulfotransferase [Acidimicrobiales bacterium]
MVDRFRDLPFLPVFVVGAPRSGTTWIQNMLGSHPSICAPPEIGLFHTYLSPLDSRWSHETAAQRRPNARRRGLPAVLARQEFVDLLRQVAVGVYESARRCKPAASVLIDKEPTNTPHMQLIAEIFPEARFVHLLRDGRDVAASLVAAHEGWAHDWAPGNVADAARCWKDHVGWARDGRRTGLPFLEVRYEDLLASPVESLLALFDFLGVDGDAEVATAMIEEHAFARDKERGTEPPGFHRSGTVGSWVDHWTAFQRASFDRTAGRLLLEVGYETDPSWSDASAGARAATAGDAVVRRVREAVKYPVRSWIARHPSLAGN